MQIVFIVTSCINVDASPLSYFHTRSVFSSEERLDQTLVTLQKIKEKIPNVTIIVANNNHLTPAQEATLKPYCDHIFILDNELVRTSPNKSFAECSALLNACHKIQELQISFDYLFKTSGRYFLMPEFNIQNWPFSETRIVSPRSGDGVVNNVLYSVHHSRLSYYMDRLQQFITKCLTSDKPYGVEGDLFDFNNPEVHQFLTIPAYVAGMCAVQPRVMWSC